MKAMYQPSAQWSNRQPKVKLLRRPPRRRDLSILALAEQNDCRITLRRTLKR
jgi:hypothetical protein